MCVFSNTDLPQTYIDAPKKGKRHPIQKRMATLEDEGGGTGEESDDGVELERDDIPADVKAVMEDIEMEEEVPDDEQWQVLEDIWLKAGEMGEGLILFNSNNFGGPLIVLRAPRVTIDYLLEDLMIVGLASILKG